MTPSTLFTLFTLMCLVSGVATTSTNYSLTNISPYIITHTPMIYTNINGDEGMITMTEFHYINTTCELPIIDNSVSLENMIYNIFYQICELILYILSYRYIINYIFITYNIYNRSMKFIDSMDTEPMPAGPIPEPEPQPEVEAEVEAELTTVYELPTIDIKEKIVRNCEDEDDNQCSYTTSKYEMILFDSNNIKIDDIVFNGECYIETNSNYLFSNNFKQIKFKNPTYKQLLMIATLSPFTEKNKIIDTSNICIYDNNKFENIQIITIKYE